MRRLGIGPGGALSLAGGTMDRFYRILENGDGTADIYLMTQGLGAEKPLYVLRGIEAGTDLEDDIRLRYDDYVLSSTQIKGKDLFRL